MTGGGVLPVLFEPDEGDPPLMDRVMDWPAQPRPTAVKVM
jgi:hypothetical protein